jgi:hypothetical protein
VAVLSSKLFLTVKYTVTKKQFIKIPTWFVIIKDYIEIIADTEHPELLAKDNNQMNNYGDVNFHYIQQNMASQVRNRNSTQQG